MTQPGQSDTREIEQFVKAWCMGWIAAHGGFPPDFAEKAIAAYYLHREQRPLPVEVEDRLFRALHRAVQ